MAAPYIHAKSCVKKWGGKEEDYLPIHNLMDSSKQAFPDNRHRAITHNIWFCTNIIPKIFGDIAKNSDGKEYIPKDVAELHCLEDFAMKFIPSIQDYLENMTMQPWMRNGLGEAPNSNKLIKKTEIYKKSNTID
jgi:membrane-bound metal-dependent hydrolase YbcI (DUF457 family)